MTNIYLMKELSLSYAGMFWWLNLSLKAAMCMTLVTFCLLVHVMSTFSAISRIIMATSAMAETPILPTHVEMKLSPKRLTDVLLTEAAVAKSLQTKVRRQYLANYPDLETREETTYESLLRHRHPDFKMEMLEAIL